MRADIHDGQEHERSIHGPDTEAQDQSPPSLTSDLQHTAGPYSWVARDRCRRSGQSGHVGFAPCVDGSELARAFFTSQGWSLQPCVRPLDAVHMTAGHNALRGSGPDRKPAFENASGRVGCPDRRIDRLCITCCSPSQPSHHVGCPTRSVTPQARRVPCNARP
jgi:hypothetical protein